MRTSAPLVRILDHDPDLAGALPADQREVARLLTTVRTETAAPGPWVPGAESGQPYGVILRGLAVKELAIAGGVSAELLGPGDLVLPAPPAHDALLPSSTTWFVLEPLTVARLDGRFEQAGRRWPSLNRAVMERAAAAAARAALLQNVAQMTRIEDRVLVLLWHLAERFGRVTPNGVVVPLRLTHRVIGRLVGARRPSVTTAVLALEQAGAISRRDDGAFVLHVELRPEFAGPKPTDEPWTTRAGRALVLDELRSRWAHDAGARAERARRPGEEPRPRPSRDLLTGD